MIEGVEAAINVLKELNSFNEKKFKEWVKKTNDVWLKYILVEKFIISYYKKFEKKFLSLYNKILKVLGLKK